MVFFFFCFVMFFKFLVFHLVQKCFLDVVFWLQIFFSPLKFLVFCFCFKTFFSRFFFLIQIFFCFRNVFLTSFLFRILFLNFWIFFCFRSFFWILFCFRILFFSTCVFCFHKPRNFSPIYVPGKAEGKLGPTQPDL